jgi:cytochrome P450
VSNFVKLIRRKYISTDTELKPMDLARKAQFLTLDVITDLAFGVPFGDIERDEDVHLYIQSTEEMLHAALTLTTLPVMNTFINLPLIGDMIFPSSKDKSGPGRLIRSVYSNSKY